MKQYLSLANKILKFGGDRHDRTGTGTVSLFGQHLEFNLEDGFPLVTTKKVFFKGVVVELLWMLRGDTNIKFLNDNGVHIWDKFANSFGDLGPVYGYQWRHFGGDYGSDRPGGVDQIKEAIRRIKEDPYSRRIVVVTGNPYDEKRMALPPCPYMFQFYVTPGNPAKLSMHVYQRSCDFFLGGPFDIAQYALLLSMIAQVTGTRPHKLIFSYGDVHIYNNHIFQIMEQSKREPKPLPKLWLNPEIRNIDDFKLEDIQLTDYDPWPAIKGEISV